MKHLPRDASTSLAAIQPADRENVPKGMNAGPASAWAFANFRHDKRAILQYLSEPELRRRIRSGLLRLFC
jgi:hypothetical protein